jgi:outer membrane lipopolysaccharide assembly protein LptE/RlpB
MMRSIPPWRQACIRFAAMMALLFAGASLNGCGYRLSSAGGSASSAVQGKAVAVPLFANSTHRPHVETILTAAMREEIARRGGTTAPATEGADLVLHGTVTSYSTTAVSYTAEDRIREYRATLTVEVTVREREEGTVLWKGVETASQDYPVVEFPLNNPALAGRVEPQNRTALQQNSEDAAQREMARKIARHVYQRMNEGF